MSSSFLETVDSRAVATLPLDHPHRHAFGNSLIADPIAAPGPPDAKIEVRALVLAGTGRGFSGGAVLERMRHMARHSFEANLTHAAGLAGLPRGLGHRASDEVPKGIAALPDKHPPAGRRQG